MIIIQDIPLCCPINRLWSFGRGGVRLTKEARQKKKSLIADIHKQLGGVPQPLTGDIQVTIVWTPRDKRHGDVDMYIKQVLDCLEHAKVYVNDKQVCDVQCSRTELIKFPGYMTISVWEL